MYSRSIRLLLVEDNPADVWLMREALRLAQFPVQLAVARDGIEASRYLQQVVSQTSPSFPDLILLDLNLPRRNGREVLTDIKRSPALQSIPVLILSSSTAEDERRRASELRASGFMTKPDNLPAYVNLVQQMEKFWLPNGIELRPTA